MPIASDAAMHVLYELFGPYSQYAVIAQAALTIWLLIDHSRRGGDTFWFWIILVFQPLGAWAYFFAVKLPAMRAGSGFQSGGGRLAALFQPRASLDELRYKAEHIPTLANRLALAQRLIEKKTYDEAVPQLESALKTEPDHGQILYSLALCHARLNRPDKALPLLEKLLAREPRWSNYIGWHLLIETHAAKGNTAGALEACRELVRLAPILQHQCLLADYLLHEGQSEEARNLLERSLRDHNFAPGPIRRRNRRWAGEARRLLKDADRT
jgi:hypothetical protein